ncbi:hypothetical protein [Shinella zoogloeoides]
MSAHNSEPYYRPHEDTRLAFDARGVYHLSRAPERNAATDLNQRLLFRIDARARHAQRFPEASDEMLDYMTEQALGIEIAAHTIARHKQARMRLDKGEIDFEPAQPKRPETLLIAARFQLARGRNPDAADWGLWNQIADFFNDGHPATGRLGALDAWGVRSAVTAYGGLQVKSDLTGGYVAKRNRRKRVDTIHPWDKNVYDHLCDAEDLQKSFPRYADFHRGALAGILMFETVYRPLAAFDEMYRDAARHPRLKDLRGKKLADRIDELFGFEATVNKIITKRDFRNSGLKEADFIPNAPA